MRLPLTAGLAMLAALACLAPSSPVAPPAPAALPRTLRDIQPTDPDHFVPARFQGKVLLITGAARGIGRATAIRAAREGARVVVAAMGLLKTRSLLMAADSKHRMATPWEQASIILFLLSEDAANVTGAAWATDGGGTAY